MILLSYIIMGHPEWKDSEIDIFAAFQKEQMSREIGKLNKLIDEGRIPISHKNVQKIEFKKGIKAFETLVCENSEDANLVITGFSLNKVEEERCVFFESFSNIEDILFVRAGKKIKIKDN